MLFFGAIFVVTCNRVTRGTLRDGVRGGVNCRNPDSIFQTRVGEVVSGTYNAKAEKVLNNFSF